MSREDNAFMDSMVSLIPLKPIKDTHFNFGGTLSLWEKQEDGNTITLEYQAQSHLKCF